MGFGLFGSVANDRMFLSARVRLLIPATVHLQGLFRLSGVSLCNWDFFFLDDHDDRIILHDHHGKPDADALKLMTS